MLRPRVIVCLDVKDGRVVKGTQFKDLRDVGDPVELAARYEDEGADEIVYLDVSASKEKRGTLLDVVRRTAETLFIPLTGGGGVRSDEDIGPLLRAGASDRDLAGFLIDAVWTKQAGHGIGNDGFTQPERTMSAIGG